MKNILLFFILLLVICIYYLQKKEIENMEDQYSNEEIDDDYNPMKSDYTKLIKSVNELGFNKRGDMKGFKKNVKASEKIIDGLLDEQKDIVKGNRGIGTKLVYNTGFKCNDENGNEQELYTYLDNSGNPNNGLTSEFANSTLQMFKKSGELFSAAQGLVDDSCSEVKLKLITNSGKDDVAKVFIQNSEINNIDKNNIEDFSNISDVNINELLLHYKKYDTGIFLYFFGFSTLCLYLTFKLMNKQD
tara:strand:+ start:5459 stop:6193 length:735 start_codon:yes stop_codon:yes gene_type:complete